MTQPKRLFADTWGQVPVPHDSLKPAVGSAAAKSKGKTPRRETRQDMPSDSSGSDGTPTYGLAYQGIVTPITFVPGILGSEIRAKGSASRVLWPPYDVNGKGTHELFRNLKDIVRVPHNGKEAIGPFPGAYTNLIWYLKQLRGERNFHPFWYDWTQSNRDSGAQFAAHIAKVLARDEYKQKGITSIDVVCHSMGGLVLREAYRINPAQIRRMVFLASPHYGAPKAFFVLHPKADLPLFTTFFEKMAGWVAWQLMKSVQDEDTLEEELKWIACRLPSVYELLPDRYYLDANVLVTDVHTAARYRIRGLEATYHDSDWGFPQAMRADVKKAMDFKEQLTKKLPGDRETRLIMYGKRFPTYDIVDYDNFLLDFDYDTPEASSTANGDESVPEWSGSGDHAEGSMEVAGDHSGLPEHGPNHPPIGNFLQRTPI